ncbi:MAG: hypothetical protein O3A51_01065 [Verrucomicrobia bacterium]|nr:hypothetical protein [Verrucomicrobiota bacterium]
MNSPTIGKNKQREGAALFTVLMIIIATSAILAISVKAAMQRVYSSHKLSDRMRALSVAEAGVSVAYGVLVTNFDARYSDDEFPATSYADGTFDATVAAIGDDTAVITCVGQYGSSQETVVLDVRRFSSDLVATIPPNPAQGYAILCNGEFHFGGSGDITTTGGVSYVHANGGINVRGNVGVNISLESSTEIDISNNKTITGDITAPVLDYNPSKVTITGTATSQAVPPVTIPDIDLTPWFTWASAHGEVHNGFNMSGGTYTANGGVIWVNGSAQISGQTTINGCIIATGEVHFGGQADLNPPAGGFSLVSRDNRVKLTTSGTVGTGLIYAKTGDLEHSANGLVYGTIIVKGDIRKTGNSDILVYNDAGLEPPEGGAPEEMIIGVTAWQR